MKEVLNTISRAFQGLRSLCDPSVGGDPYMEDTKNTFFPVRKGSNRYNGSFGRRRFAWKNY
jgi:hypothetical protein